jgi:hypothetical protein
LRFYRLWVGRFSAYLTFRPSTKNAGGNDCNGISGFHRRYCMANESRANSPQIPHDVNRFSGARLYEPQRFPMQTKPLRVADPRSENKLGHYEANRRAA